MENGDLKKEISTKVILSSLLYLEKEYGNDKIEKLANELNIEPAFLKNSHNWFSMEFLNRFFDKLIKVTNDKNASFKGGTYAANKQSWGPLFPIFILFGNPGFAYKQVANHVNSYNKISTFNVLELKSNYAKLQYFDRGGPKESKEVCLNRIGQLSCAPTNWHLPSAKVKEIQCQHENADSCIYEINWLNPTIKTFRFWGVLIALIFSIVWWSQLATIDLWAAIGSALLFICGYSLGKNLDFRKTLKETISLNEQQNEALEETVKAIEQKYDELQKAHKELRLSNEILEHTYQELDRYKNHLEELVEERTKKLREAQEQLVQSEKMASLGQVAAGVAHEINTPLCSIQSALETVRNFMEDIKKQKSERIYTEEEMKIVLESGFKSIQASTKIVDGLLDFSRKNREGLHLIDIHEGIESVLTMLHYNLRRYKIKIHKEYGEIMPIHANLQEINQVLMNILNNAITAIENGEGNIWIKTEQNKHNVKISIKDDGEGIKTEIKDKIFDPFFTTKKVGEGTGLGLSISYNIIEKHKGKIDVESEEGKGSTFKVVLPINNQEEKNESVTIQ